MAIECYRNQTWQERELIVVDDGTDCVEDLFRDVSNCRYFRTERFQTVGEKVNYACEQANGEVIVTFDDDDWYAPQRIEDQVTRLIESGKQLTGYHSILFFDGKKASRYSNPPDYCTGTSQVYWKAFWKEHKFPPIDSSYDNALYEAALPSVVSVDGQQMVVARIHGANVSGIRAMIGAVDMWPYVPMETLPAAFFEALR